MCRHRKSSSQRASLAHHDGAFQCTVRLPFALLLLALVLSSSILQAEARQHQHQHSAECDRLLLDSARNETFEKINMTEFDDLLKPLYQMTVQLEKHPEGGTFDAVVELQRKLYYSVASNTRCIRTICEIGFNSGSSALIWLLANPTANVVFFDLFTHKYSPAGEAYLRSLPQLNTSRLTIIKGSSLDTVPEFTRNVNNTGFSCDLLSVDGSHRHADAVTDIQNMMVLASPSWNALFVDDTNCAYKYCVDNAIKEHYKRGNLRKIKGLLMAEGMRGVSLFKYSNYNRSHTV